MIQSLLPVLRELGLVTIFWDVYFGSAGKLFDTSTGQITDPAYAGRLDKFLNELVWMARALRYAAKIFRRNRDASRYRPNETSRSESANYSL